MKALRGVPLALALVAGLLAGVLALWPGPPPPAPARPVTTPSTAAEPRVRLGYFHGGRTGIAFRTYVKGYFEREGVGVDLMTCNLHDDRTFKLPPDVEAVRKLKAQASSTEAFGKMSGEQLLAGLADGTLDGVTMGEASFLSALSRGVPLVAVCSLGHDRKKEPGHAVIFRTDIKIRSGADLRGRTLLSRRAGPGDETMMREFVRSYGLDPDKDVTIRANVDDDVAADMVRSGRVDGGFFHLLALKPPVEEGHAYVFRPLDWVDAEVLQCLLVFRKDYLDAHRDEVARIVRAITRRAEDERCMSRVERNLGTKGERIDLEFHGLNLPDVDCPPYVRGDMLALMQDLLVRNRFIDGPVALDASIDRTLVDAAAAVVPKGGRRAR